MSRPVKHVLLHAVPFVAGVGQLKANLSADSHDFTGLKMLAEDAGVAVSYRGQEFFIPWGNVVCATFAAQAKVADAEPGPKVVILPKAHKEPSAA